MALTLIFRAVLSSQLTHYLLFKYTFGPFHKATASKSHPWSSKSTLLSRAGVTNPGVTV